MWVIQSAVPTSKGGLLVTYWNGPRDSGVVSWSSSPNDLPRAALFKSKEEAMQTFETAARRLRSTEKAVLLWSDPPPRRKHEPDV